MNKISLILMSDNPRFPPKIALVISIVAVSTASIFIRFSSAGPIAIAAYRLIFSTLIIMPFFVRSQGLKTLISIDSKGLLMLVAVGFVLALHFASWITSLSFTSVASSVIFVHVDPIFVALVSHFVFRERLNLGAASGILIAFLGASLLAWGDIGLGGGSLYGDLLALFGALMLGIYILAGRKIRQRLSLLEYVTPVYAVSAIVLTLGCIITQTPLFTYAAREYAIFLAIAIIPMIFGHTIYNWTLRWISAPIVSISLLGEPIGASILAYFILREVLNPMTMAGGIVTLVGILICAYKRK